MGVEQLSTEILVLLFFAFFIGSLAKGITGMGLPMVAVPIMVGFMGVEHTIVVLVIPSIATNGMLVWAYRKYWRDTRQLLTCLVFSTIGAWVGTELLDILDPKILKLMIVLVVGTYLASLVFNLQFEISKRANQWLAASIGSFAGISQGATGLSGFFLASYFHALRLSPGGFVLSVSTTFLIFAIAQGAAQYSLDMFTAPRALQGILALIPVALGMPVAMWLAKYVSRRVFNLLVVTILVIAEIKLLYDIIFV